MILPIVPQTKKNLIKSTPDDIQKTMITFGVKYIMIVTVVNELNEMSKVVSRTLRKGREDYLLFMPYLEPN